MYKFFKLEEFSCRCCGKNLIAEELVKKLDMAREISGVPYKITSGYRCEKHNTSVGGSENSSHKRGLAADIYTKDHNIRMVIFGGLIKAGFKRIGIAKKFIHVDIDKKKSNCLWLY
jgi:uncharacterized protein YcbK (DUF882 family)